MIMYLYYWYYFPVLFINVHLNFVCAVALKLCIRNGKDISGVSVVDIDTNVELVWPAEVQVRTS
jgi:hypothetical protein